MIARMIGLAFCAFLLGSSSSAQEREDDALAAHLIALERSALQRWLVADPGGYLDLYAPDVSYFDPGRELRVDGKAALETIFAPLNEVDLSETDPRFEMVAPSVKKYGDVALLTFNLRNFRKRKGAREHELVAQWNATEVYRYIDGRWKIVHSHWSYTQHTNPLAQ